MRQLLAALALACSPVLCHAQNWSSILSPVSTSGANPRLAIDWSNTGLTSQGGIPTTRTLCGSVIAATGADQSSAINTALSGCGAGHYVLLGTGTFLINSSLSVPSNVTLRGSGANQTVLDVHGTSGSAVNLGSGTVSYAGVLNITAGATAGSTSITLSGNAGVAPGGYLVVSETNAAYVTNQGGEGPCTWCDGWNSDHGFGSPSGTRARGQIVEVEAVAGNVVTISPGLYTDYTNTPTVVPFTASAKFAGVEDLQIFGNNTGYTNDIALSKCAYCWVKGVEVNYTDGDYIEVSWGFGDEIRNNYFSNAFTHAPGGTDADIFIDYKTSNSQIVNNIVERSHAGIMLNWGAAGNVVAYNYTHGEFDTNAWNFVLGGIDIHGAHPQFNLIEGNTADNYYPDQVWGSSSNNTTFRNWFRGTTLACNPLTGRGTITCSTVGTHGNTGVNGWWTFQVSVAENIAHLSWYDNSIDDVTGSAAQQGVLTTHNAITNWVSGSVTRDGYSNKTWNMAFGYGESNDDGNSTNGCSGGTGPCHSGDAYATATIFRTYTHANAATNCILSGVNGSCNPGLPASFYLPSKPPWWGNVIPFPAIGSDITGGTGPGGHASLTASNPAQWCFTQIMGGTEGGAGGPRAFNESACYQTTSAASGVTSVMLGAATFFGKTGAH